jgi:hypothetical protein
LKRYDHICVSNNESMFIFGGNGENSTSNDVYEFNFGNPNSIFLFKNLLENENYSDCTLVSNYDKKEFNCHKFIISQSEYIFKLLKKQDRIELDIKSEILIGILNYLYCGNLIAIPLKDKEELYVDFIKTTNELNLYSLNSLYLSQFDSIVSIENVLKILILSEKFELKILKSLCIYFFKQNVKNIKKEKVLELDKEIIYDLFNSNENQFIGFSNENSNTVLEKHILNLYETKDFSDVYLISSDLKKFKCHKGILANSSEYFSIMFGGNFEESWQNEIILDDLNGDTLEYIIHFIYTRDLSLIDDYSILINLMKFSDFSIMSDLFQLALDQLISLVTIENALEISQSCAEFENSDDTRLRDKCMEVIKSTTKEELVEIIFTQQEYQKTLKDQIKKQNKFITKKEHENIVNLLKSQFEEEKKNLILENEKSLNLLKELKNHVLNEEKDVNLKQEIERKEE